MAISADDVKGLRTRTGAGMMDCKRALEEAGGDIDKAAELLRVKGQAQAAKRGAKEAAEGAIGSYVHSTGKMAVLVEVRCETDFVARNEDFKEFAHDLALHIAAANPLYVNPTDVPGEEMAKEREILLKQVDPSKPAEIRERIVDGRIKKWKEEIVLLDQPHVHREKFDGKTIEDIRAEVSARTGERIVIERFTRLEVGSDQ